MPEYKEVNVSGRRYQRCTQIVVDNPYGATPKMAFAEEEILHLGEHGITTRTAHGCSIAFDANGSFPLLNPLTGEPLGQTVTHQQVHAILYSAYKHAAQLRDQEQGA